MKLTEDQENYLKEYLRKALKYRETYNEVYDHISTALTSKIAVKPFESIIDDIIATDFGGYDGLQELEKEAKKATTKRVSIRFIKYFTSYFRLPKVMFTLPFAVAVYCFSMFIPIPPQYLLISFIITILAPGVVVLPGTSRLFSLLKAQPSDKVRMVFINHKPSLNENAINKLMGFPIMAFALAYMFYSSSPIFITVFQLFFGIYAMSIIQLYKYNADTDKYITELKTELER